MFETIYTHAVTVHGHVLASLPAGAWDLQSFLTNAKSYAKTIGGAALMLLGVVGLIWGGVQAVKKLMGGQQHGQHESWGKIVVLIILGGALMTGGFSLLAMLGSGGQTTIKDLGGGVIVPSYLTCGHAAFALVAAGGALVLAGGWFALRRGLLHARESDLGAAGSSASI